MTSFQPKGPDGTLQPDRRTFVSTAISAAAALQGVALDPMGISLPQLPGWWPEYQRINERLHFFSARLDSLLDSSTATAFHFAAAQAQSAELLVDLKKLVDDHKIGREDVEALRKMFLSDESQRQLAEISDLSEKAILAWVETGDDRDVKTSSALARSGPIDICNPPSEFILKNSVYDIVRIFSTIGNQTAQDIPRIFDFLDQVRIPESYRQEAKKLALDWLRPATEIVSEARDNRKDGVSDSENTARETVRKSAVKFWLNEEMRNYLDAVTEAHTACGLSTSWDMGACLPLL